MSIQSMSVHELSALLQETNSLYLLDVRTPAEYEIARIEGSHLLPLNELTRRLNEIPTDQNIVVICHHGVRSLSAAMYLENQLVMDIYNLSGGINEWSNQVDPAVPLY